MKPTNPSYPTGDDLLAMRDEEEPIRYICEKLRVTDMGPADYIRTKHEVRDFLKAGGTDRTEAEAIVQRAQGRIEEAASRDPAIATAPGFQNLRVTAKR